VLAVGAITWLSVRDDGSTAQEPTSTTLPTGVSRLEPTTEGIAAIGTTAPDFQLTGLDGRQVRLSDLRGTPVVLNFWASWCTPCRAEFPLLHAAARDAHGRYAVVGVNTDDIKGDAKAFAKEERATWPNGVDTDGSVKKLYGVRGLPQTVFIDADGKITGRVALQLDAAQLERGIAKARRGGS